MQHFVKGLKEVASVKSVFHVHFHLVQVAPINSKKQLQANLLPELLV